MNLIQITVFISETVATGVHVIGLLKSHNIAIASLAPLYPPKLSKIALFQHAQSLLKMAEKMINLAYVFVVVIVVVI